MKPFQAQASISGLKTMMDGTVRLTVDCQELPPSDAAVLHGALRSIGWFLYQEQEFTEIPDLPGIKSKSKKSQSKRLRDVLYLLWQQDGTGTDEEYYQSMMEKIIQFYREKIED